MPCLSKEQARDLVKEFMSTNDYRAPLDGDKMAENLHRILIKYDVVAVAMEEVPGESESSSSGSPGDPTETTSSTEPVPSGTSGPEIVVPASETDGQMMTIRKIDDHEILASVPAHEDNVPDGWEIVLVEDDGPDGSADPVPST